MSHPSRICAQLGLVVALAAPRVVHAADAPEAPAAAAPASALPRVDVSVVGEFPDADAVGAKVRSWFEAQAVPTHVSRAARLESSEVFEPSQSAGVRVWVLLPTPASARLFFAVEEQAGAQSRYLVHDVELSSGLDELGMEQLAQVAYLSANALWAGTAQSSRQEVEKELGVPARAPAPKPKPTPLPAKPAPSKPALSPWGFRGGFEYSSRYLGDGGLSYGMGANAALLWQRASHEFLLSAKGAIYGANGSDKSGVELDFSATALALVLSGGQQLSEHSWLVAELGPGLEEIRPIVRVHDSSLRTAAFDPHWSPWIHTGFGFRVGWGRWVGFRLMAVAAVPLERHHYDIADTAKPGGREELLSLWAVQPGLSFGVFN